MFPRDSATATFWPKQKQTELLMQKSREALTTWPAHKDSVYTNIDINTH